MISSRVVGCVIFASDRRGPATPLTEATNVQSRTGVCSILVAFCLLADERHWPHIFTVCFVIYLICSTKCKKEIHARQFFIYINLDATLISFTIQLLKCISSSRKVSSIPSGKKDLTMNLAIFRYKNWLCYLEFIYNFYW